MCKLAITTSSLLFLCMTPLLTKGGVISYDFSDGTTGGLMLTSTSGFSNSVSGGADIVSKAVGTSSGYINLATPFNVSGDFTAVVTANRTSIGSPTARLRIDLSGAGSTALTELLGTSQIEAETFLPTSTTASFASDSVQTIQLQLQRTGNTITESYNDGGGFQVLQASTDPSLAIAQPIVLDLDEQGGNSAASSGTFRSFSITSQSVPEPSLGCALVGLLLLSNRRRRPQAHQD